MPAAQIPTLRNVDPEGAPLGRGQTPPDNGSLMGAPVSLGDLADAFVGDDYDDDSSPSDRFLDSVFDPSMMDMAMMALPAGRVLSTAKAAVNTVRSAARTQKAMRGFVRLAEQNRRTSLPWPANNPPANPAYRRFLMGEEAVKAHKTEKWLGALEAEGRVIESGLDVPGRLLASVAKSPAKLMKFAVAHPTLATTLALIGTGIGAGTAVYRTSVQSALSEDAEERRRRSADARTMATNEYARVVAKAPSTSQDPAGYGRYAKDLARAVASVYDAEWDGRDDTRERARKMYADGLSALTALGQGDIPRYVQQDMLAAGYDISPDAFLKDVLRARDAQRFGSLESGKNGGAK